MLGGGKERPAGASGAWRAVLLSRCPLLEGSSLSPCSRYPCGSWLEQRELWQGCPACMQVFESGCKMIQNW